jgi:hypothetical protein
MSSPLDLHPKDAAVADFVGELHRQFQEAFSESYNDKKLTLAKVARRLGVNRSVVWRRLKGCNSMTEISMAELAWAMGRKIQIHLSRVGSGAPGDNYVQNQDSLDLNFASTSRTYALTSANPETLSLPTDGFVQVAR